MISRACAWSSAGFSPCCSASGFPEEAWPASYASVMKLTRFLGWWEEMEVYGSIYYKEFVDLWIRSPCQNGGTCMDNNGFSGRASCQCLDGFTGDHCEIDKDDCSPNPCANGGNCTDIGPSFHCHCPTGFGGRSCSQLLPWCNGNPCNNGGTCYEKLNGFHCSCLPEYSGSTCAYPTKSKSFFTNEHIYNFPPHHKGFHHPGHEVLKITMKETVHNNDPLLNRSQIICFIILGLLTCLIVLITTGIVFFSKCETWLANAKYSHLIRKKKDFYMKASREDGNDVKIIFPEKVKLANYSRSYTTI